jgi:hypothetical protein
VAEIMRIRTYRDMAVARTLRDHNVEEEWR